MNCLHCGDCCKRMNPFNDFSICRHLAVFKGGYFLCQIYENRPEECKNHEFPHTHCPLGIDVLKITDPDQIRERIDKGYEYSKKLIQHRIIDAVREVEET